jgi:hypothetical protein
MVRDRAHGLPLVHRGRQGWQEKIHELHNVIRLLWDFLGS